MNNEILEMINALRQINRETGLVATLCLTELQEDLWTILQSVTLTAAI